MKKGTKLICIDNTDAETSLTLGKEYTVKDVLAVSKCIKVDCDESHFDNYFWPERFKVVEETPSIRKLPVEKIASFHDTYHTFKKPHLRVGQTYMNALFYVDSDLYHKIHGTELDCFYLEERVEAFLTAILPTKSYYD